jgi:hypothetical protein
VLSNKFVVGNIIAKLPPYWKDFATSLKHRRQEFSVAECRGVKTTSSIVCSSDVRVRVFGGSGGLKNTIITEETQWFILVRAIGALCPAADDPYTQEHPKSRRLQLSVREREIW